MLVETILRFGWRLFVWCLMDNHFHLVFQTPEPNLAEGMHWLEGTYAAWFNRRHGRWGHLYGGRYKSMVIEKEAYLAECVRYVVLNPVRAGMVKGPEEYEWSSYRATAGLEKAPEWLDRLEALKAVGVDPKTVQEDPAKAIEIYSAFVAEKIGSTECLWDKLVNGIFLGTEEWLKQMRQEVQSKPRSREHPKEQRAVGRPDAEKIVEVVASLTGKSAERLKTERGGPHRRLIAYLGWYEGLLRLRVIAEALGLKSLAHVSNEIRRCGCELDLNPELVAISELALRKFQQAA